MKVLMGNEAQTSKLLQQSGAFVSEIVSNMRTVISFTMENKLVEFYKDQQRGPVSEGVKLATKAALSHGFSQFSILAVYSLSFYVGGRFIECCGLNVSDMFRVLMAVMMAFIG